MEENTFWGTFCFPLFFFFRYLSVTTEQATTKDESNRIIPRTVTTFKPSWGVQCEYIGKFTILNEGPEEKILCANSAIEELCLLRFYMMCGGDENDLSTFSSCAIKRL